MLETKPKYIVEMYDIAGEAIMELYKSDTIKLNELTIDVVDISLGKAFQINLVDKVNGHIVEDEIIPASVVKRSDDLIARIQEAYITSVEYSIVHLFKLLLEPIRNEITSHGIEVSCTKDGVNVNLLKETGFKHYKFDTVCVQDIISRLVFDILASNATEYKMSQMR